MTQAVSYLTGGAAAAQPPTLLSQQTSTSLPQSSDLEQSTDLVLPDQALLSRLSSFPEEVYDLLPTSHLLKLMTVLLGESGVGQLRKRYMLAQLQNSLSGTHFLDLDRFYGALFGYRRLSAEVLAVDPYTQVATQDEWDQADQQDASYRSRIAQFAQSLALGGTPQGLAGLAQSVIGAPCEIVETGYLVADQYGQDEQVIGTRRYADIQALYGTYFGMQGDTIPASTFSRTYGSVEQTLVTYSNLNTLAYASIEAGVIPAQGVKQLTYGDLEGGTDVSVERTTADNRAEFLVLAHRPITLEEQYAIVRTLTPIKPADALMTVEQDGLAVSVEAPLRSIAADSEDWSLDREVTPPQSVVFKGASPYLVNFTQPAPPTPSAPAPSTSKPVAVPKPPLSAVLKHLSAPARLRLVRSLSRIADYPEPDHSLMIYKDWPSDQVRWVQERLMPQCLWVDGKFGPYTDAAVRVLQQTAGLPVTGVVDVATRQALVALGFVRTTQTDAVIAQEEAQVGPDPTDPSIVSVGTSDRVQNSDGTYTDFPASRAAMPYQQVMAALEAKEQVAHPYGTVRRGVLAS